MIKMYVRNDNNFLTELAQKFYVNFGITAFILQSRNRKSEVVALRNLFCLIAREAGISCTSIAKFLDRHHSTILYLTIVAQDYMDLQYYDKNVLKFYKVISDEMSGM